MSAPRHGQAEPHPGHWHHVAQHWDDWAPPLRPSPADTRLMESWVRQHRPAPRSDRSGALLWGVTPEIATMAWPRGTELLAVDRSREMVEFVWPGDVDGVRRAQCANWLEYSDDSRGFDTVIGDGSFSVMDFPNGFRALARKAHTLLNPRGILVARLFAQAPIPETPEAVLADLRARRIGSFHVFKFRLAMALQPSSEAGVRVGDVFEAWTAARIEPRELAVSMNWSEPSIRTIDHYENTDGRLTFSTFAEFDAIAGEFFDRLECHYPDYEMGDRCPLVCYRRRG